MKKFPKGTFGASCRISAPKRINPNAPISPMAMPSTFLGSIFSLMTIAERIKTMIGVVVTNTELFIGVESARPLKKTNIFNPIPKIAQMNKRR